MTKGNPNWTPGRSGNPAGRPRKEHALADLLRAALSHKGEDGKTLRQSMMQKLTTMAVSGDLDAIKVVLERIDGKVPDTRILDGRVDVVLSWDDDASD